MSKVYDIEKLKKERSRSPYIVLIVMCAVAVLVTVCCFCAKQYTEGIIAGLFFLGAGVGLFFLIRHMIVREDNKTVPGTASYAKEQQILQNNINKKRSTMFTHKSLHDEMNFHNMMISGVAFGAALLLTLFILFAGFYSIYLFVIDIGLLIWFISCLSGSSYKKLIKNAAVYGENEQSLSADFQNAAFVRGDGSTISLSSKYIIGGKDHAIIPRNDVIWAFGRCKYIYMYNYGAYSGRREEYNLVLARSSGDLVSLPCDKAGIIVMLEQLAQNIPVGYSYDMYRLYTGDKAEFAEKAPSFGLKPGDFLMPEE